MKRAVIFGGGNNYKTYEEILRRRYNIIGIVDNNPLVENVVPPKEIYVMDYDVIIITPTDYVDIFDQLIEMGIEREKIIILTYDYSIYYKTSMGLNCFGQHFDDLIIAAIFGQLGIEKPSYIDLGANFPFCISNTALMYLSGCRGVAVEANPMLVNTLRKCRPDDIIVNVGISTEEGVLPFYKFSEDSGRNTFSKVEAEQTSKIMPGHKIQIVNLPVTTLNKIISEYFPKGFPDFLDCDIEGLDYAVLEQFDLYNNGPKVICVEVRKEDIKKFDDMLQEKDYFRFCRIGENNIYVKNKYKNILCHQ